MIDEVHVVRNKRELNSVLKNYRPQEYGSVYSWLRQQTDILPQRYPATLLISSQWDSDGMGAHFHFQYLYENDIEKLSSATKKAKLLNDRTTRRKKQVGIRPIKNEKIRNATYIYTCMKRHYSVPKTSASLKVE